MKRSIALTLTLCSLTSSVALSRVAAAAPTRAAGEPSERETTPRSASARLLAAADADGDGSLSRAELGAVVERAVSRRVVLRFKQLDRNRDGLVTRGEVPRMPALRFGRFDLNQDGRLSRAELSVIMTREAGARLAQRFAELDADGDMRCTRTELAHRLDAPARTVVALGDRTRR